jgi:predicted CopG family antitoxin
MRTFKVSDDVYEQLKSFVVDPFDDTPDAVIGRLVEIVNKAKSRWSPFEEEAKPSDEYQSFPKSQKQHTPEQKHEQGQEQEQDVDEVVLL